MPYEIPKSKASLNQNRFQFQFPGSKKIYSMPLLKYIRPSVGMALETMTTEEAVRALFEEYFPGQDLFAKFEDTEQFEAFVNAWQEESGISVGESAGSPES